MARLAWQNVDAPNLAPAMQGFANVTTLLQKALESASTNPMLENQIKQEELNAKIRKAKNDANTLAADRAINAKVAMSPSAQALQQSLQSGQLLGEDYLDATPEVISGARTAVGDMLTNSLKQDEVSALVPDKILAKLGATAPDAATAEAWRKDPTVFNNPALNGASAGAWEKFGSAGKVLAENSGTIRKEGEAVDTSAINKRVDSIFGLALAGAGSKTDIRNNAFALAKQAGFTGPELTELTNRLKSSDIGFADPIAEVSTVGTTGGKTGSTPAGSAIAGALPNIDTSGINSGLNSAVLRNTYGNRPLPENINTLGDLFDNKQSEYFRGTDKELHTPTGPLQIVADTFARHGEKIYGKNWREQSLNDPKVHYDIGESIFKETGGNVDKLIGQWDALKKLPRSTVEKIAKAPWSEAAPIIAAAESGSNSGAARSMKQISNPDYTNSQVSNVSNNASRAIAQFSADPIVLNYSTLNSSKLTADQVALDGVKTSVDFGSLNKDEMDLAARNIKRTIEYVQKQAGGNISPELAFAVAKQAFGDENFRILWLNSDLNLNTTKMNKIIKSLNDKGGIPDQANELTKMQGVFSKLEAANTNVSTLQQNLIDAKRNNGDNPYNTSISKAQAALDRALETRTQIAKEIENSSVFQPKENVTVEQELSNNNTIKGGGGSAIGDALAKQRQLDKQSNTTKDNATTPPTVNSANNFVNSRQGNVNKALAESLSTTNPSQVKPVAAPISIPVKVDGKSGTGTTFKVDTQTGKTVPVTPLKLDPNVKYEKPVTVVKADRSGGAKAILYYVGDGDGSNITLSQVDANNLNNGKTDLACRMDTIDADETTGPGKSWTIDQPNGIQARDYLRNLIASGSVTVIVTKPAAPKGEPKTSKNNYGRPLCKIEIEGVGIDMSMIKAGMATWYSQYSNDPALKAAEEKAKQDKVGRWKNPDVMNPADFRHGGWRQFLK
jgi:endonuclease YncB( thermonuclease family)